MAKRAQTSCRNRQTLNESRRLTAIIVAKEVNKLSLHMYDVARKRYMFVRGEREGFVQKPKKVCCVIV